MGWGKEGAEAQAGGSVEFQNRAPWQEWGVRGPEETSLGVRDFEDLLISPEGEGWCSWFPEGVSRRGGSPVVVTGDVEPRCDVVY